MCLNLSIYVNEAIKSWSNEKLNVKLNVLVGMAVHYIWAPFKVNWDQALRLLLLIYHTPLLSSAS